MVESLLQNPERTYVQVEMKFFSMWWYLQPEDMKANVRKLVDNGQLEMINGGWSMHDEACPSYEDMINNHMIGHEFLLKEFGVAPRIGWQIDPFGHSNTNARFFAEQGFDAWFFGRQDWEDVSNRYEKKETEWIWRPNNDSNIKIMTHKMYWSYDWTPGPDFDVTDSAGPIITNENSASFNADKVAEKIISGLEHQKIGVFLHDEIFQAWGGDFEYMNAFYNFEQLDRVIKYINSNPKYNKKYFFKYSTPSTYIDAISQLNQIWPVKYDDLFPYADRAGAYWTGYFTSRANLKGYIRRASSYTHATNALFTERMLALDTTIEEAD